MENKVLKDQVAIVTGGSTGIGAKATEILAKRGAKAALEVMRSCQIEVIEEQQ